MRAPKIHKTGNPAVSEPAAGADDPPWAELLRDVTVNVLGRLATQEIWKSVRKVCAAWAEVCQDPDVWRVVKIVNSDPLQACECANICRIAVDRSQGQLINLTIENFGDDDLLCYIALRSSELRRLTICCGASYHISGTALSRAVTHFPDLEELYILTPFHFEDGELETIGVACPKLKSFTLNRSYSLGNKDALSIAKHMPNLWHLRLLGSDMNNDGLEPFWMVAPVCSRLISGDAVVLILVGC
ncbi:hypothetical protein C2S52_005383 [Perilla frutescens var. hirtella]|nr:hypothetical protein C2S51_010291 [Perilla frutescens var. frutescens]KAH6794906.1 hypothetical protein C2S52_005383 [Perilla frutescens var. hirtella]